MSSLYRGMLQERLARKEVDQIDQQLVVAHIRRDIAEKELANHETQMQHAQEVSDFLQSKFTSAELYRWMVKRGGMIICHDTELEHPEGVVGPPYPWARY